MSFYETVSVVTLGVYGATGWIGRSLAESARHRLADPRFFGRREARGVHRVPTRPSIERLAADFEGLDVVINVAGLAHVPKGASFDQLWANTTLPATIAGAAAAAGVRRVVHLSSIKAATEGSAAAIRAGDPPNPTTSYGRSKLLGEIGAASYADSIELVIVRPPLVVGRRAPGNFGRIDRVVQRGWPVPLPRPYAKRSLVVRSNLVDLLMHLATTPHVPDRTVHAAEDPPLSTRCLVVLLSQIYESGSIVVPLPLSILAPALRLLRRSDHLDRLARDLIVEPSRGDAVAGWRPRGSILESMSTELLGQR